MTASPDQFAQPEQPSFEQALDRLNEIVHLLEEGELGLSQSLDQYEQGVRLLKQCYALLERAERRVEQLCGLDADGNPLTAPFDDQASVTVTVTTQSATTRRSQKARTKRPTATPGNLPSGEPDTTVDDPGRLF